MFHFFFILVLFVCIIYNYFSLWIARNPPDEDPAVVVQKIPAVLKVNQEILARFKDDGWYYRGVLSHFYFFWTTILSKKANISFMMVFCSGTIKKTLESNTFVVEDGVGDMEKIIRDDIITDNDDADSIIHVSNFGLGTIICFVMMLCYPKNKMGDTIISNRIINSYSVLSFNLFYEQRGCIYRIIFCANLAR